MLNIFYTPPPQKNKFHFKNRRWKKYTLEKKKQIYIWFFWTFLSSKRGTQKRVESLAKSRAQERTQRLFVCAYEENYSNVK